MYFYILTWAAQSVNATTPDPVSGVWRQARPDEAASCQEATWHDCAVVCTNTNHNSTAWPIPISKAQSQSLYIYMYIMHSKMIILHQTKYIIYIIIYDLCLLWYLNIHMVALVHGNDDINMKFQKLNFVSLLTHWGRVTHLCISKLTTMISDNGLSPEWCQSIIWTNAGILLIGTLGTKFSEILNGI